MSQLSSYFNSVLKLFVHISSDNRIHFWEVDTCKLRRVYLEKNHLAHVYTCCAWLFEGLKNTSNAKTNTSLGLYAVGTSEGTIILWDLARGVVSKTIGIAGESPIPTDITFSKDGKSILVVSSQQNMVQYDITTGDVIKSYKALKKGAFKMALNPKVNVVAIAGSTIKIIDLDTSAKKKLDVSIVGSVSVLTFSNCGRYLFCAGSNGREILVFDVQDSSSLTPIHVIPVNGHPIAITCKSNISKRYFDILTTFEESSGAIIRIYEDSTNYDACKINSDNSNILGCSFGNVAKGMTKGGVTLAHGKSTYPTFTHYEIDNSDGTLLAEISIKNTNPNDDAVVEGSSSSSSHINEKATILGPVDMGGKKRPTIDSLQENDNKKLKTDNDKFTLDVDISAAAQTLEQRLESLSANMTILEQQMVSRQQQYADVSAAEIVPTSESLVTLIEQSLQSGDNALLEQCLATEDSKVIEQTCKRLPTNKVVTFLKRLVGKFEKRPSRGILLIKWLSSLFRYHTSYLVSIPDLSKQLAGLSMMIESRLACYNRLASLSGRLDLLMAQVSSSNYQAIEQQEIGSRIPRSIYTEE